MKTIYRIVGVFLYLVSKSFREKVRAKRSQRARGLDDRIKHRETVIAVLNPDTDRRKVIE